MAVTFAVTKTWEADDATGGTLPLHDVIEVQALAEVPDAINWRYVGHGVYYGDNGRCGKSGLVTFIARPFGR